MGLPCCPPTLTGQKHSDTHWKSQWHTEQSGHWDHPWHPRCPSSRTVTQPHLTHVLDQQRGSLWDALERGVSRLVWEPGCSSCHQQSLQPARSPTLNSFPILYSLPADNRLSIRSPPEHLQLSSLSRTSAWPRERLHPKLFTHEPFATLLSPKLPWLQRRVRKLNFLVFSNKSTAVAKHRSKRAGFLQVWGKSNEE